MLSQRSSSHAKLHQNQGSHGSVVCVRCYISTGDRIATVCKVKPQYRTSHSNSVYCAIAVPATA
eukprot:1034957-Rhodomonas_salina.2